MLNRQSIKCVHTVALVLAVALCGRSQADLVSQWTLDGGAADAKAENHGVLKGAPAAAPDRYGDAGKALAFDAKDDCVVCGSNSSLSFGDGSADRPFSITAWVKMKDHEGFAVVTKAGEYSLGNSNHFRFWLHDRQRGARIGRSAGLLDQWEGKWVHLAATYDGSGSADGIKMYADGALRPSRNETQGDYVAMTKGGNPFTIGRASKPVKGAIDDVRIYSHALSPEEIQEMADFFAGAPPLPLPVDGPAAACKLTVGPTQAPPAIDGNLSDEVWRKATWYDAFHVMGDPKRTATPKTSFAVAHDGNRLYIAVKADEPEPGKMRAQVAERDGSTWMDDSVEIFLDTMGDARSHVHLAVNTKGMLYDAQVVRGGGRMRPEWRAGAEAAAEVGPSAWGIELAVPFSNLSLDAAAPATWRMNVTRSRFVSGSRELFTYAPVRGGFHQTGSFAVAKIADVDLAPFLRYRIGAPEVKSLLRRGKLVVDVELPIENRSSQARKVDLRATLCAGGRTEEAVVEGIKLGPGTHRQRLSLPIPATGEAVLRVALHEAKSPIVVCSRETPLVLDYRPFSVEVRRPSYGNAIFAGQKLDEIVLEVETDVAADERQDYAFEFVLKSDREHVHSLSQVGAEKAALSFHLPRLTPGRYTMEGRLVHRPSGGTVGTWQDVLRTLPPRRGEVRFDEHGVCLVDNRPFVPYGLAGDWWPKGIWDAIDLGCNAIENCSLRLRDDQMPQVDELHAAGLKLVVYPFPKGFPVPIFRKRDSAGPVTPEQEQALRAHVRKRMHHPAVLAWYTGNEPQPDVIPPSTMKQIHDIITDEDPHHPTVIINNNIHHIAGTVDAMALVMPDPYPGYLKNGTWARPNGSTDAVQETVRACRGRKPVWVMMQAHNGTLFKHQDRRAPSFVDLRNQLYQSVAAGAKGFYWYCRYWIEPHVEIGIAYLAKEVALLQEAILAPESPRKFTGDLGEEEVPTLHVGRREVGKHTFLFAISTLDKARKLTFRAAELPDGSLFVVGEARKIELRKGAFTDSFAPYETHIYTTDRQIAERLPLAAVRKQLEENAHPPVKPGNLAHRSHGTKVELKVKPLPHRCPPADGIIDGSPWSWWKSWGKLPHTLDLVFPKPVTISRVVVDSNISDMAIQAQRDGKWVTLADVQSKKPDARREVQTISVPATTTSRLRVVSRAVKGGKIVKGRTTRIWEIEVYGRADSTTKDTKGTKGKKRIGKGEEKKGEEKGKRGG